MASIPRKLKIDFSPYRKDLVTQALDRMLSQFIDACVLRQFVAAIMGEVQCLHDALIDLQEQRTLYMAEGENLAAIGRIVGEDDKGRHYSEEYWMFADRDAQCADRSPVWTLHAPTGAYVSSSDTGYTLDILSRIAKNHTLTASVPEIQRLTGMIMDTPVSFEKTGPMQVNVLVPAGLAQEFWDILTQARTNRRADDIFRMPYPATLWFDMMIVYYPDRPETSYWFCADRANEQRCDVSPCTAGIPINEGA